MTSEQSKIQNLKSKITIRPATPDDAAAIVRLNEAHNDARDVEAGIRQRLAAANRIETLFLAEIDGYAVGFLCLRLAPQICTPDTYAEVNELFVEVDYRRRGVAKALMDEAVARATAAGATELLLLTNFRNTGGQRFYHAQDFENYSLAMRKRL